MNTSELKSLPPSYKSTYSVSVREVPSPTPPACLTPTYSSSRTTRPIYRSDPDPIEDAETPHATRLRKRYERFNIGAGIFACTMVVVLIVTLIITRSKGKQKDSHAPPTPYCTDKSVGWWGNIVLGAVFFSLGTVVLPLLAAMFRRAAYGLVFLAVGFFLNAHTCYWGYMIVCPKDYIAGHD